MTADELAEHTSLRPALDAVLREARRARERRGREGNATLRLGPLGEDEARELDALLAATGWRRRVLSGERLTVPLARFEAALEAGGHDPASVYAAIDPTGPVRDRPAERRTEARRRQQFWEWLRSHPVVAARVPLRTWVDAARESGTIGPADRDQVARALRVVAELPRGAPCDRAVFSAELFGDAHALDDDERLGRLACALLRAAAGLDERLPARAVWERASVRTDVTSSSVLTLGLAPGGDGPLAAALRGLHGHHVALTLGQLQMADLNWRPARICHTCENPAVLRAAERRLGARCPPVVCTEGWPSDAARFLLRELHFAGWRIRHHGDFDLGGVAIMQHLASEVRAVPWRFDVESYERALAARSDVALPVLRGDRRTGDPLERALLEHGLAVCEELVVDDLIEDLQAAAR